MSGSGFRADIQGLRAIAVMSVVLFHVWPSLLPGGFVGVDVFFVISGFLITGHLFREAEQTGTISLLRFYDRRIRRLLPAACTVLVAVAVATLIILPQGLWEETAWNIVASALYFENWHLASLAVDYLASESDPSPVQHYWSLSVEEQFYIGWPLLVIAACRVKTDRWGLRSRLIAVLSIMTALSLAASVWITATDPEAAYFVTQTRIWQLGAGGLLALGAPGLGEGKRRVAGFAGVLMIVASAFLMSSKTAFPGYAALVPTLGAVLVLLSGESKSALSVYSLLRAKPLQFLGDTSYSIYLWHWPLIIFYQQIFPGRLSPVEGTVIIAVTILAAYLSRELIERPFLNKGPLTSLKDYMPWKTVMAGGASTAMCAMIAGTMVMFVQAQDAGFVEGITADKNYPGPAVLLSGAKAPRDVAMVPSPTALKKDKPQAYEDGCHPAQRASSVPRQCVYGDPDSEFHVILAGDSHAAQWLPAMEQVAKANGWKLTLATRSACMPVPFMTGDNDVETKVLCSEWGKQVLDQIERDPPKMIIWSNFRGQRIWPTGDKASDKQATGDAIAELWTGWRKRGISVVAIADTPYFGRDPSKCTSTPDRCVAKRKKALQADPVGMAHEREPEVPLIDMNDALCDRKVCPAIIGNVVAWRDRHHITATYSRMLAQTLAQRLAKATAPAS